MGTGTVYSNIDTRGFDSPYGTLTLTQTEDHSEEKNDLYISQDDTTCRKCFPCQMAQQVLEGLTVR